MKCLTTRQPWASLLMAGRTRFDVRRGPVQHRGRIAVHAGANFSPASRMLCGSPSFARELKALGFDYAADLPTRALLGTVDLIDCVPVVTVARRLAATRVERLQLLRAKPQAWLWLFAKPEPLPQPFFWLGKPGLRELPAGLFEDPRITGRLPPPTDLLLHSSTHINGRGQGIPAEHPSARQTGQAGTARLIEPGDPFLAGRMKLILGREGDPLEEPEERGG